VDAAGRWFAHLQARGECIDIRYGYLAGDDARPAWHFVSHEDHDGIAGFARLLARRGIDIDELPARAREHLEPHRAARAVLRQVAGARAAYARWRALDDDWQPRCPALSRPTAVGWCVLTADETRAIDARRERAGVASSAWLLHGLHAAVTAHLDDPHAPGLWVLPINMRTARTRRPRRGNHLSFLDVEVRHDDARRALHDRIRRGFARGEHLAGRWGIELGGWLGPPAMRALAAGHVAAGFRYLGTLSHFGDWQAPRAAGAWLACPPATRLQPLAAGALIWNGRLALMIQAHPALTRDAALVDCIVTDWRQLVTQGGRS